MTLLNYSTTLVAGSNENVNDVRTMFDEARAVINNLDNENIKAGAAIDYSKINVPDGTIPLADLATLATGEIICGNAGVPTKRALGGAATIGATGGLTIGSVTSGPHGLQNIGISNNWVQTNAVVTLTAGVWAFWGSVILNKGDAGGIITTGGRLRVVGSFEVGSSYAGSGDASGNVAVVTHHPIAVVGSGSGFQVALDARAGAFSGANMVADNARILAVKLA